MWMFCEFTVCLITRLFVGQSWSICDIVWTLDLKFDWTQQINCLVQIIALISLIIPWGIYSRLTMLVRNFQLYPSWLIGLVSVA